MERMNEALKRITSRSRVSALASAGFSEVDSRAQRNHDAASRVVVNSPAATPSTTLSAIAMAVASPHSEAIRQVRVSPFSA
jgi:hypothetical protein